MNAYKDSLGIYFIVDVNLRQVRATVHQFGGSLGLLLQLLKCTCMGIHSIFIHMGFYIAFNTVQIISRRQDLSVEETSTYSWSNFCTVNC